MANKKKIENSKKSNQEKVTNNLKQTGSKTKKATTPVTSEPKKERKKAGNSSSNVKESIKTKAVAEQVEKTKKNENVKAKKTVDQVAPIGSDEVSRLVRIILILVVIAVAFYALTVVIMKFKKPSIPERNVNNDPAVIQYDEILIGTMLEKKRNEYYVLIEKNDDPYRALTSYYLQKYKSKKDALKVYYANMNDVLNSFHVSKTSNIKASEIKDFKVSDVTLVKIKNKRIIEAYEGIDNVEKALQEISNTKK